MNCDFDKPCKQDNVCNLDTHLCEEKVNLSPDVISTKIQGKTFIGKTETIHNLLSILFEHEYDVKCTLGQDYIEFKDFKGSFLSEIENAYISDGNPTQLVSFIDIDSGQVMCSIRSELIKSWETQNYEGFMTIANTPVTELKQIRNRINEEASFAYFYTIDLWQTKFITTESMLKVKNSNNYIFIIYPTQYKWYDTAKGIGVHHNWGESSQRDIQDFGNKIYGLIPIGPEREILEQKEREYVPTQEDERIAIEARERMIQLREEHKDQERVEHELDEDLESQFGEAIANNNLEEIQQLLERFPFIREHSDAPQLLFLEACKQGKLEIVQYFFNIFQNLTINDINEGFQEACSFNQYAVIQWILSQFPQVDVTKGFLRACMNGHLDLAESLYESFSTIDPTSIRYQAFRLTALRGHLNVVQWLVNNFPPSNDAIRMACRTNSQLVKEWLQSRFPEICV